MLSNYYYTISHIILMSVDLMYNLMYILSMSNTIQTLVKPNMRLNVRKDLLIIYTIVIILCLSIVLDYSNPFIDFLYWSTSWVEPSQQTN